MATFSYIALDDKNEVHKGTIEQYNRAAVLQVLAQQSLRPVKITKSRGGVSALNVNIGFKKRVKTTELVIFTRQLSVMISAGVPLLRALHALSQYAKPNSAMSEILVSIIKDVEAGSTLSDAMAKHPSTFNTVYINMVHAGESAGILDNILKRLAIQQERSSSMVKKIRGAMAYPMVLLCITVIAFFALMIFIIPQIGSIVTSLSDGTASLPGITVFMLGISHFLVNYWYVVIIAAIAIVVLLRFYIGTPHGRKNWDSLKIKLPLVGPLVQKIIVSRFTRTFSSLMGAGVSVLESIHVTSKAVGNTIYYDALENAAEEIKNGKTVSEAIGATKLFPDIVMQMLEVGEETGQIDTVLVKVADFYDEEVDVTINSISTIIEPVMIVLMGGMVGLVAASVMLPIAQMSQNVK